MTDAPTGLEAPAVSVVIPAYNAAATLGEQLAALTAQAWSGAWEIVVVDNGSTDSTRELVDRESRTCPRLRLVSATERTGPSYARNVGARHARGRSLAFCDADDVVAPGWLAAIGEALAANEFVGGPVELRELNPQWLWESRGSAGTDAATWFENQFPFASSCNVGFNRARFLEQRGFDESLQVGEDIELSMRLHLQGVRLLFVADAIVHYRYRPTLRSTFERAIAYGAAHPTIAELWRARSGQRVPRSKGFRNWLWLVRHLDLLGTQSGRGRWLWVAGKRLGALRGSLTVRRLYL